MPESVHQQSNDIHLGALEIRTKSCRMGGGVWVEGVYAYDLIVSPGGQKFAAGRESNGMDCARVIAHGGQLSGFGVGRIASFVDGIRRPNADMTVYAAFFSL